MGFDLTGLPDEKPKGDLSFKKSSLDLSMIPDEGSEEVGRTETLSTYKGPPKWSDMGLWDKLTVLSNPYTMNTGLKGIFKESPEDMQAKSINAMALSKKLNIPPSAVYENYDKIMKDPSITGINFSGPGRESSSPISRAYEFGEGMSKMAFPALIGAGLVTNPLATLGAVGTFTGVSEATKATGSLIAGKDYQFGMPASDLLPADSSETVKSIFDMAEFFGSALATGGLVKGWNKIIPGVRSTLAEKLFRDVITEYRTPQKIYVSPERVRAMQVGTTDEVERGIVSEILDGDGGRWRQALRMGVDIEIPAEKLIKIIDKPWFGKLKQDLNKTGIFRLSPFEEVRLTQEGPTTGRARPTALLPAPGEGATGVKTSVLPPGEPGSPSPLSLKDAEKIKTMIRGWYFEQDVLPLEEHIEYQGLHEILNNKQINQLKEFLRSHVTTEDQYTLSNIQELNPAAYKEFSDHVDKLADEAITYIIPKNISPLYQTDVQPATEALDRIKQEIQASGFDAEYAEATAALLDARSRVWAVQTGKTPAEYFEKWGLTFKKDIWVPKVKQASNLGEKKETLIGWLKTRGGVWDESLTGETAQFGSKEAGMVGLVSKAKGQSFDELADHAVQDGWLPEGATAKDFIDLLSKEIQAVRAKNPEARAVKSSDALARDAAKEQALGDQAGAALGEEAQLALDLGYDYYGPHHEISAGSLQKGDKVMILGEEYEHQGFAEKGNIRLRNGQEYILKPEDIIPAEAVKRVQGELFQSSDNLTEKDYIVKSDGSPDLGFIDETISQAIKRESAPIRLNRGNDKFGEVKIEIDHGKEIRGLGYKDVKTFIFEVANNFDAIYSGSKSGSMLLAIRNGLAKTAVIELGIDASGSFYSVITAFPAREGYLKNKKPLWEGAQTPHSLTGTPGAVSGQSSITDSTLRQTGENVKEEIFQGSKIPKGSLSFTDQQKAIISFFQSADLSTAPHEIFHLFLEDLHDTAQTAGVPDQVQKDMQAVLDWMGIKSWEEIGTAHKERWARAGEKYLGQGKAPSEDLKGVFERFKDWILSVYRVLRDLNVNLTKKMKGVFDRMLATEEEIQNMKAEMDIQPLWKAGDPPLGITPEAWSHYGELAKRAAQATSEAIEQRRLTEYSEAKAGWKKEAETSFKEAPEHQIIEDVVRGGGFNKELLLNEFDEKTVADLARRRPGLVREDGKMSHTMVAFGSGDVSTETLVSSLINSQTREEFIDEFIKTRSEEFDSEIPLGETAITEEYLTMIQAEMAILLDAATKGKGTVPANSEVKKRVRRETGQTKVENLVTESEALRAGLMKAAQAAREAMKAGKIDEALIQKGRQREIVMNLRERYQAQREVEQARDYFSRVAKSKTIDWDFKAQIMDLLADHGVITRQEFPREGMPSLRQFVEELRLEGEMIDISDAIIDRTHIGPAEGKTYEQLMDLKDTVKQLEHLGRIRSKLIAEDQIREIQEAVDEITDRIKVSYGKKFVKPSGHLEFEDPKNILQKAGEFADQYIKELIKPEVIIRLLDGLQDMGPVWQNTFAKIKASEDKEIVMGRDFMKRLQEVFDKIPMAQRKVWLDQKVSIPEIPEKFLTRSQMIMVALNSGNLGNRNAMKGGSGPDPEQMWTDVSIQAVTDKLSREEWQIVQEVWSLVNELYKPLDEVHRTMTGVPLKKVEGITVKTPYGEVEGQYFPLMFDPKQSKRAERFMLEQAEKDMFSNYYAKPTPASGFTKERVGGKMFPLLDFSVITKHLNDVIHFVSHALEIRDVNKVLSSGDVRTAIEQSLGENAFKQIGPWLQYVARSQYKPITAGERALGWARKNASIVIMGFKASTALLQPLAATQAIDYLGLGSFSKGLTEYYAHPIEWSNFIKERSPMMSVRYSQETLDREMAQFAKQFNPTGETIKDVVLHSFFAWMNVMDASVAYPTWMAAYKKGMDKYLWNEKKSVEFADMTVRLTQASSSVKDQALAMQGKEGAWKLFTMFQTFFNAFFNRIVERAAGFNLGTVGIGGLMAAFTWLILVPVTIQEAAFKRHIPGPTDIGREAILYLSGGLPVIRDLANVLLTDYGYKGSPAFGPFYEAEYLRKSITAKHPSGMSILKHSLMLGGYAAGLPTAQAVITLQAVIDLIDGKDKNPLNLILREPKEKK